MQSDQENLLRPTLRADLDVSRFDRPWDPSSLVYIAFFGGIAGGGALFALNAKRLGMSSEFKRLVIGTIVLTLLFAAGIGWLIVHSESPSERGASPLRMARFGAVIVAVFLARWIAKRQQPSYDAYDYSDRPRGRLWPYAVAAIVLGAAIQLGLVLGTTELLRGMNLAAR